MIARLDYDGIWVANRYYDEPEDYIDECFDDGSEPDTSVEICRVRPFKMRADWAIDAAYEFNEVDPNDDVAEPDEAAVQELQTLLDGWAAKHLARWSFPTGDMLDISDLIEQRRNEEASNL